MVLYVHTREAEIFLQKQWQIDENLAKVLKEHQWDGIRHMWWNVVIGPDRVCFQHEKHPLFAQNFIIEGPNSATHTESLQQIEFSAAASH